MGRAARRAKRNRKDTLRAQRLGRSPEPTVAGQVSLLVQALHRLIAKIRNPCRSFRDHVHAKNARRTKRIRDVKNAAKTKPCADCGLFYGAESMEFDHRPGEIKLFTIGDGKKNMRAMLEEIAKCDVVCCPCHEAREVSRGRTHGRGSSRICPNVARRSGMKPLPLPSNAMKSPDPTG